MTLALAGAVLSIAALAFVAWLLLVFLFTPRIDYHATCRIPVHTAEFAHLLQSTCQASIHRHNRVDVLTDGTRFYPAMLEAIQGARQSINLESYICSPGRVANLFVDALAARARAGVEVRVVLDALGSASFFGAPLRRLREAGCAVSFYQPVTWHRLHRLNNRTHRELLIVDGRVAFTGGAGIADWWSQPTPARRLWRLLQRLGLEPGRRAPVWRDTMVRIEGPAVAALQGVFAENWLECRGEILTDPRHWPALAPAGSVDAMLVKSSPADRATVSRVVFQMLIEGATASVDISTPYFLPDKALCRALADASARGVRVRIVVPGRWTDQRLVRLASRRMYGELLAAGVRVYEYRPAMTHVKALMVDGDWAVVGTTNVDNRSFEHNDEVNVAFRAPQVVGRLLEDFEADLARSDEVTPDAWRRRSRAEKLAGLVCWILERQQ